MALALYLRAGKTPPAALVNGTTTDTTSEHVSVPSVLLTPEWVTTKNMNATVIADNFVPGLAALRRCIRRRLHRSGYNSIRQFVQRAVEVTAFGVARPVSPPPAPAGGGAVDSGTEEEATQ